MRKKYYVIFNRRSDLANKHAFLSPSQSAWTNYDSDKLKLRYHAATAARKGVELHDLASKAIRLGVRINRSEKPIASYVNDAIKYGMTSEQPLFYSENCFGTADAISFKQNKLRIHDLKTGMIKAKQRQLEVYAALFCLEYAVDPYNIEIELRIYQGEDIHVYVPDPAFIEDLMNRIIYFDDLIEGIKVND
jgi:hypothetical protein